MKLGDYLEKELIIPALASASKAEALAELISPLASITPSLDAENAVSVLLEREKLGTTGIGDGIAIPHGKLESLDKIRVIVGRSANGVEFEALDFKPCHIFFLVLAPEQVAGLHLRLLAQISRLLKDEHFRTAFLQAEDEEALWKLLKNA